jgi:hypothetical protein
MTNKQKSSKANSVSELPLQMRRLCARAVCGKPIDDKRTVKGLVVLFKRMQSCRQEGTAFLSSQPTLPNLRARGHQTKARAASRVARAEHRTLVR